MPNSSQEDMFEEANTTVIYDSQPVKYLPSLRDIEPVVSTPLVSVEDDFLDGLNITDLYSTEQTVNLKEVEIQNEIGKFKWFYLKHKSEYSISLSGTKFKEYYLKVQGDKEFIGNKFKELIDPTNKIQLLTQLVNERRELLNLGKLLFYSELYISTRNNKSVKKLFKTYVGEDEANFLFKEKEGVKYNRFKFIVHKNRLVYCSSLLKSHYNMSSLDIQCIKNYDDVLKYVLNSEM